MKTEGLELQRLSSDADRPKAAVGMTNCRQSAYSSNATPVVPIDRQFWLPSMVTFCALSDRHSKDDVEYGIAGRIFGCKAT